MRSSRTRASTCRARACPCAPGRAGCGSGDDGRDHRQAETAHHEEDVAPVDDAQQRRDRRRREGETDIAAEAVQGEEAAHAFLSDRSGKDRVVARMKYGVADARDQRQGKDLPERRREGHQRNRERHHQRAADQKRARAIAVDQESDGRKGAGSGDHASRGDDAPQCGRSGLPADAREPRGRTGDCSGRGVLVASGETAGGELGIASDSRQLCAHAMVRQADLMAVRVGQQARIVVDADPEETLRGTVSAISEDSN